MRLCACSFFHKKLIHFISYADIAKLGGSSVRHLHRRRLLPILFLHYVIVLCTLPSIIIWRREHLSQGHGLLGADLLTAEARDTRVGVHLGEVVLHG
jgi:hypothetical protein